MSVSPGGPAKLCDKSLVRAEALCAYGERQKMHQQYFLLGASVKRHRLNRCLWLLQALAKFLIWTVQDWIARRPWHKAACARASLCSLCLCFFTGQEGPNPAWQEGPEAAASVFLLFQFIFVSLIMLQSALMAQIV